MILFIVVLLGNNYYSGKIVGTLLSFLYRKTFILLYINDYHAFPFFVNFAKITFIGTKNFIYPKSLHNFAPSIQKMSNIFNLKNY